MTVVCDSTLQPAESLSWVNAVDPYAREGVRNVGIGGSHDFILRRLFLPPRPPALGRGCGGGHRRPPTLARVMPHAVRPLSSDAIIGLANQAMMMGGRAKMPGPPPIP